MTEAELLRALAAAKAPEPTDDPGMTTAELAMALYGEVNSWTRNLTCEKVRLLMAAGRVRCGRRKFLQIDGRRRFVPVWIPVTPAKRARR